MDNDIKYRYYKYSYELNAVEAYRTGPIPVQGATFISRDKTIYQFNCG